MRKSLVVTLSLVFMLFGMGSFVAGKKTVGGDIRKGIMEEYIVKPGDTLRNIAEDSFGSWRKWRDIAQANNITDPDQIRAGQNLVIPYVKLAEYFQTGIASWYGDYFHGKPTSNGEPFDMHAYTAAHRSLPLGTIAKVTNADSGEYVIVTINDRGPYIDGRVIDLSYEAAKTINIVKDGINEVSIHIISTPDKILLSRLLSRR